MTAIVRVVGCGNDEAGDDAVGLAAVRMARASLDRLPGVEVVEAGPGLRVLDLLEGPRTVIVVDGVRTRGEDPPPGSMVRITLPDGGSTTRFLASSHGFGIRETVGLAAALGLRSDVVVLGVEVEAVGTGEPLSPRVREALPGLVGAIVAEAENALTRASKGVSP